MSSALAAISPSCSSPLRDKSRDACFHHFIESLPGLNAIDFVQRIVRKGRDVKILSHASRRQLRHSVIDARVPQNPTLGVVDEVAAAGKADGLPDIDSRCPTRFVGATAVTAVDHIEAVYSGLDLRVGGGGNSHDRDGGRQHQDRNREGEGNVLSLNSPNDPRNWTMVLPILSYRLHCPYH